MKREFICAQLEKMGIPECGFEILQDKAGVAVARVFSGDASVILKCFEDIPSRREIANYRLLESLSIPTLRIIDSSDAAMLMEDMSREGVYRLAEEADMRDADIAGKLAVWYRKLHDAGFAYVKEHGAGMYSEADLFSRENVERVKRLSHTENNPVWNLLEANFERIRNAIDMTPMTITYNDFYYTNMAVARDGKSAIMFDYNLLGKGHVYSDMRNVLSSLSAEAGEAFIEAYGAYDTGAEKSIDNVISPIVTLHMAYQREIFPKWAQESLDRLKNGYDGDIEKFIEMI